MTAYCVVSVGVPSSGIGLTFQVFSQPKDIIRMLLNADTMLYSMCILCLLSLIWKKTFRMMLKYQPWHLEYGALNRGLLRPNPSPEGIYSNSRLFALKNLPFAAQIVLSLLHKNWGLTEIEDEQLFFFSLLNVSLTGFLTSAFLLRTWLAGYSKLFSICENAN
jgi:hypothetical protein